MKHNEAGTHTYVVHPHTDITIFHKNWHENQEAKQSRCLTPMFLSLCLSEREPFIACSVAADKAGPFVCGSHSESEAGEHLPKHSPTIDLHYPLHSLNRSVHFCSLQTIIHLKRDRQNERGCNENIFSPTRSSPLLLMMVKRITFIR